MKSHRIISLLLAALLTLSIAAPCAASSYYDDTGHYDTAFEDMLVTGISTEGVDEFCKRFVADPIGQYDALLNLFDGLDTQVSLLGIISDCNAGDEAASYDYEQAKNDYVYAADRLYAAISAALAGPQGDALRALMPEDEADSFVDYEAAEDEDFEAAAQEATLVQQYYLLPYDDDFPDAAAEIYLKLAALRREMAEEAGFDSYADYAYAASYDREYVPEDAQRLHRVVKSSIAPLYVKCVRALAERNLPWDDDDIPGGDEVIEALAAHMGDVSPELTEAMDFLRRNHLYRIGSDESMQDMGYTVSLPSYRSAFLFNKVGSRSEAFQSTVHEFGHFNAAYHDDSRALYAYSDIDVSEVQSQGLEMLFIPCLQDILAPDGSDAERSLVALNALRGLLSAVVDGCMYDEFEQAVYADPDMTVEGLHQLEADLNAEYGLDELYEPDVFWPYISHLFEQPFYYVSYAASALPALDIWLKSQEDYGTAVDIYLNVSAASAGDWFLDVMEENGLCDVTSRRDVTRLADALETRLNALIDEAPVSEFDLAQALISISTVLIAVLLPVVIIVSYRRRRRRAVETEAVSDPWDMP